MTTKATGARHSRDRPRLGSPRRVVRTAATFLTKWLFQVPRTSAGGKSDGFLIGSAAARRLNETRPRSPEKRAWRSRASCFAGF